MMIISASISNQFLLVQTEGERVSGCRGEVSVECVIGIHLSPSIIRIRDLLICRISIINSPFPIERMWITKNKTDNCLHSLLLLLTWWRDFLRFRETYYTLTTTGFTGRQTQIESKQSQMILRREIFIRKTMNGRDYFN